VSTKEELLCDGFRQHEVSCEVFWHLPTVSGGEWTFDCFPEWTSAVCQRCISSFSRGAHQHGDI